MRNSFRLILTSVAFFVLLGPVMPVIEVALVTLLTKGRLEINPSFYLAAVLFGALIAAALGLGHGILMALAVRIDAVRRRLDTRTRRILLGTGASLFCGLAMTAVTLYTARNSYGSLLGAMDPNHPDPWAIIRAYMVIELFIVPALACGILFQLLPWSRRVMQNAIARAGAA